jgi:WD40 repeat protein
MWRISHGASESVEVSFLAELSRHSAAVNCVRFSPDGAHLASGGDDNVIIVWQLETAGADPIDDIGSVEKWRAAKILRR